MDCLKPKAETQKMIVPGAFYIATLTYTTMYSSITKTLGLFSTLELARESVLESAKSPNYKDTDFTLDYEIKIHELDKAKSSVTIERWVNVNKQLTNVADLNKVISDYSNLTRMRKEINV